MYQGDRYRGSELDQTRSHLALPRRKANPVLALQRAIGNRATTRMLARDARGSFDYTARIGGLGPIEIKESNVGDWIARKSSAEDLIVTSAKGKHSGELKKLSDGKARNDTIEVTALDPGSENSWVNVTFRNARVKGYAADASGKTESWKAVDFDEVNIVRLALGEKRARKKK